jgi:hypothetical protein
MKSSLPTLLTGLALILGGIFAIAAQQGYLDNQTPQFWMAVFGGFSLFFLVCYLLSGIRAWGWLFPTLIFASLALIIFMSDAGVTSSILAAPIFIAVGLPFLVAFAFEPRRNWWALIPAWVMGVLCVVVSMADRFVGEWIATLILLGIGLPFFVVYLTDRTRWWALIPGGVLTVTAFIPLLAGSSLGVYLGSLINLLIGLAFLVVYLASPKAWWAIIPAGLMLSIGIMTLLTGIFGTGETANTVATAVMFLGWAGTFGLVWLRHDVQSAQWAKYPALVFAALAGVSLLGLLGLDLTWPIVLIALGLFVIYRGLRRRPSVNIPDPAERGAMKP